MFFTLVSPGCVGHFKVDPVLKTDTTFHSSLDLCAPVLSIFMFEKLSIYEEI